MRDLEKIQERDEAHAKRRLGIILLAGLATATLVLSIGTLIDRAAEPAPRSDSLAPLDGFDAQETPETGTADVPRVETETLSFPHDLLEGEERPEVLRALRAAAAEEARLARLAGDDEERGSREATPTAQLIRHAARDPGIAAALAAEPGHDPAPHGHDGKYTLQVISYGSPDQARNFAAVLRARGHRAFIKSADVPERGRYYRVRIGPFSSRYEAESYRREFEEKEHMTVYVVERPDA